MLQQQHHYEKNEVLLQLSLATEMCVVVNFVLNIGSPMKFNTGKKKLQK